MKYVAFFVVTVLAYIKHKVIHTSLFLLNVLTSCAQHCNISHSRPAKSLHYITPAT